MEDETDDSRENTSCNKENQNDSCSEDKMADISMFECTFPQVDITLKPAVPHIMVLKEMNREDENVISSRAHDYAEIESRLTKLGPQENCQSPESSKSVDFIEGTPPGIEIKKKRCASTSSNNSLSLIDSSVMPQIHYTSQNIVSLDENKVVLNTKLTASDRKLDKNHRADVINDSNMNDETSANIDELMQALTHDQFQETLNLYQNNQPSTSRGDSTILHNEPIDLLEDDLNLSDDSVADPDDVENTTNKLPTDNSTQETLNLYQNNQPSTSRGVLHNEPVDLLEDDLNLSDDSVADPNYVEETTNKLPTDDSTDTDNYEPINSAPKKRKTARWHKRNEKKYTRNVEKMRRSECLPYKNAKGKSKQAKLPKRIDCKCRHGCMQNFTENERIAICKNYWGLKNYNRQKDFILLNVTTRPTQRKFINATKKRNVSREYHFTKDNNKIRVCQKFFEHTLCISNGPISKAFSEISSTGNFAGEDKRGKHAPHNKSSSEDIDFIKQHIDSIPKIDSHYCRQTSSKQYLDSELSVPKMYSLYEEECDKHNKSPVSINVYRNIFGTEFNLDFHKPKKDLCLLCAKYKASKANNSPDLATITEMFEKHIELKNQSYEAKDRDKKRANEDANFNSVTLDMQKVLHIPTSNISLLYYLRKLNVYNLSIYEGKSPNNVCCYLWAEMDGKKGSCEVGTAVCKWITELPDTVTEISLFSDTCAGQNRNQYLTALYLYIVQKTHLNVIEHNYLESGHSHMEVDSVHSAIEHQLKLMPIFSMMDLCNVVRLGRSNRGAKTKKNTVLKEPYRPIEMKYTDIKDLKKLSNDLLINKSVANSGETVQWLKIKCLKFEKTKPYTVQFRYDYVSDFNEIDVRLPESQQKTIAKGKSGKKNILRKRKAESDKTEFDFDNYEITNAYAHELAITKAKKKDLLKMCREKIIPPILHGWFENLPEKSGRDYLPEEDEEEEEM